MEPPISAPPPIIRTAAPVAAGMSSDRKIAIGLAGLGVVGLLIFAFLVFFLVGSKRKLAQTRTTTNLVNSNAVEGLLNDDQRLVMQFVDRKFHKYFDARTFEGWSNDER